MRYKLNTLIGFTFLYINKFDYIHILDNLREQNGEFDPKLFPKVIDKVLDKELTFKLEVTPNSSYYSIAPVSDIKDIMKAILNKILVDRVYTNFDQKIIGINKINWYESIKTCKFELGLPKCEKENLQSSMQRLDDFGDNVSIA